MNKPQTEPKRSSESFSKVFAEELLAIQQWRDAKPGSELGCTLDREQSMERCDDLRLTVEAIDNEGEEKQEKVADEKRTDRLQAAALNHDLCGLAISGGGIRSATFALGVLQGMAFTGLLRKFDYLSTVSGGGYIGSWLTVGIQRHGFTEMERCLLPARYRQETTPPESADHPSIRHLRLYGNYLAPRPGVFTVEGWLLIAIFLRNMLLHQLVLLFATIGLVFAVRGVVEGLGNLKWNPALRMVLNIATGWSEVQVVPITILFLSVITLIFGSRQIKHFLQDNQKRKTIGGIPQYVLLTLSAALLYLGGLVSLASSQQYVTRPEWLVLLNSLCFTALGLLQVIDDPDVGSFRAKLRKFGSGLAAGALAGSLSGLLFLLIANDSGSSGGLIALWSVFGVPLLIVGGVLTNFLYVGFAGRHLKADEREFWSLFNARALMLGLVWFGLFGLVVFGPGILMEYFGKGREWVASLVAGGWMASLFSFLWAAQSEKSGNNGASSWRELFARIAPFAFLVTLFAAVALVTTWLAYDVFHYMYSEVNENSRGFVDSIPYLLSDLDVAKNIGASWSGFVTLCLYLIGVMIALSFSHLLGQMIGINQFSLHELYRNRLVRCYLGATNRARQPNLETGFDFDDDITMSSLLPMPNQQSERSNRGPFPIINFALNQRSSISDRSRLSSETISEHLAFVERKARPFFCTPYHTGSIPTGFCRTKDYANDIKVGTAMAISGAAVSPNMGYHSSPLTTMLLTIFNLRLGAWFGNPACNATRKRDNPSASLKLMLDELAGKTGAEADYIYLSDGGHFDNTGVYELIRRRCRFIVVVDAGSDPQIHENIGRVVRMARIDFGVNIDVDMSSVTPNKEGNSSSHVTVGRVHYAHRHAPHGATGTESTNADFANPSFNYDDNHGIIVWIKNTMTGTESADLKNFRAMNDKFPYDPTSNQFYGESRFESYRMLGFHSVFKMLENVSFNALTPVSVRRSDDQSRDVQSPARFSEAFTNHLQSNQVPETPATREPTSRSAESVTASFHWPSFFDRLSIRGIFEDLFSYWLSKPKQFGMEYIKQNETYVSILEKLRTSPSLSRLAAELYGTANPSPGSQSHVTPPTSDYEIAERLMIGEMMTMLENVWFALDLERNRLHPVHAGWMAIYKHWIDSPTVKRHWNDTSGSSQPDGLKYEFSPVFRNFVDHI